MKKENKSKNTFIMFLLAFLIGFFVVSFIEVLRSSFAPVPDMQTASAVSNVEIGRTPGSFADPGRKVETRCCQYQYNQNNSVGKRRGIQVSFRR